MLREIGFMSRKTSEARKSAFFAALAATGNQTISAERAKVSRSWVSLHRASDPAFRARMEGCIAAARAALGGRAGNRPSADWGDIDGEELVIRGSNGRRAQVSRARLKQWTARVETRFLSMLAATCNVKAACRAAGMSPASAYGQRKRFQAFRDAWEEALEIGAIRLEMAMIDAATRSLEGLPFDPDAPIPPMRFDDAFRLMRSARKDAHAKNMRKRWRPVPRSLDEVRESILTKLAAIAKFDALEEAEAAGALPGWAGRATVLHNRESGKDAA
jgi:hypothetical protein